MFITKSEGEKISRFLGDAGGFRIAFKLAIKTIFEQTYNF